jgi:hypothetical protein
MQPPPSPLPPTRPLPPRRGRGLLHDNWCPAGCIDAINVVTLHASASSRLCQSVVVSSAASSSLLSLQVSQYSSVISALRLLRRPPATAAGFCLSSFIRPSFMHIALDVKVIVHKEDLSFMTWACLDPIHFEEQLYYPFDFLWNEFYT